jgi:hypothetical protein
MIFYYYDLWLINDYFTILLFYYFFSVVWKEWVNVLKKYEIDPRSQFY